MGKPVDSVLLEAVERASGILESNIEFLEDDIEGLTEFQDRVSDMELGSNGSSNSTYIGGSSNTSDTGKVVGWFEELVYSRQDDSEFVEEKAERFDLSEPSAHFLQELLSISNIDDGDVLANIRYLDSGNAMGPSHVQEVISLAEYPKASRKEVVDDIEIARNSLENYRHELSNLDNHITELNEDYILPMSLDDAVTVVRYFDVIEDRLDQLEREESTS